MIDTIRSNTDLDCEVCDDNDHCLPRWEDDGGGMQRPPWLAQAFEEDDERDHGDHDFGRPDGARCQSI